MKTYYLTTAIDYANGPPHLGHAFEKVLTDVIARHRRLRGDAVHYLTGLDEHGQKVQQTAMRKGIEPQAFVDSIAPLFLDLCRKLEISNDDFVRTTEPRHEKVVQDILQKLYDAGEIYQDTYAGYYSVRQEQFVSEADKIDDEWPEEFGEVSYFEETNYFFRLSKYQDWLIDYLRTHPDFIFPAFRQKQVVEFLKQPINDLCISRPKERLAWGIELPFDSNYVSFVWFDALLNYISAVGYGTDRLAQYWPADYNVIGKDILVPSHSVYWPIMLHAIGMEPPKALLVHGWWTISGAKMSKSTGQVINPLDLVDQFGADAFRYFVTREMNVGQDAEFSLELYLSRYNSDLANDLGNLLSRLLNMGHRYLEGGVLQAPTVDEEPEQTVRKTWEETAAYVPQAFDDLRFHLGLEKTFAFISAVNRYAEVRQPWKLAKSDDPTDQAKVVTSLAVMAEGLRLAAQLLAPVMPSSADRIVQALGLEKVAPWADALTWSEQLTGKTLGEKFILFPRPQPTET